MIPLLVRCEVNYGMLSEGPFKRANQYHPRDDGSNYEPIR